MLIWYPGAVFLVVPIVANAAIRAGGLEARGGGIVLMHDLQGRTARAIGPLLARLEEGGYKVVQLKYGVPPQKDDTLVARLATNSR